MNKLNQLEDDAARYAAGTGPGSEFDKYLQRLGSNDPVEKIDLCKQLIGPGGCTKLMQVLRDNNTVRSVLMGADEIGSSISYRILTNFCQGADGAKAIGETLLTNRTLKTIYIGCNKIGDSGTNCSKFS